MLRKGRRSHGGLRVPGHSFAQNLSKAENAAGERGGEIPDGIRKSSEVGIEPRGLWGVTGLSQDGRAQGELVLLLLRGQERFQAGSGVWQGLNPSHGACPDPRRGRRDYPARRIPQNWAGGSCPWMSSEIPPSPFHDSITLMFPFSSCLDQSGQKGLSRQEKPSVQLSQPSVSQGSARLSKTQNLRH